MIFLIPWKRLLAHVHFLKCSSAVIFEQALRASSGVGLMGSLYILEMTLVCSSLKQGQSRSASSWCFGMPGFLKSEVCLSRVLPGILAPSCD